MTKNSTIWEKALEALNGSGGENGIFRRKLASVHSFFPHSDINVATNVSQIYEDTFELLSPALHLGCDKQPIIRIIFNQITNRHTFHLINELRKRPTFDIRYLLSSLITMCMNDIEKLYDACYWRQTNAVLSTSTQEAKALVPMLRFTVEIAMESDSKCETVLDAGILDMLLRIYVIFPSFSQAALAGPEPWITLLKACRSALRLLAKSMPNRSTISAHPVSALWTDCDPLPPAYSAQSPPLIESIAERGNAWRRSARFCVKRRVMMIYIGCLWRSNVHEIENLEACADIVEFARPSIYENDIVELAILTILKQIVMSGDSAHHLIASIGKIPDQEIQGICSGVVRLWIEGVASQLENELSADDLLSSNLGDYPRQARKVELPIEDDESFYDREKDRLLRKVAGVDKALFNIMAFCTAGANHSAEIRRSLLQAGALSLVLATFVNIDFRIPDLIDALGISKNSKAKRKQSASKHGRGLRASSSNYLAVPLDVIHTEASNLTVLIGSSIFRETWSSQSFDTRRSICLSFAGTILGGYGGSDDRYAWTRSLFRKILT